MKLVYHEADECVGIFYVNKLDYFETAVRKSVALVSLEKGPNKLVRLCLLNNRRFYNCSCLLQMKGFVEGKNGMFISMQELIDGVSEKSAKLVNCEDVQ